MKKKLNFDPESLKTPRGQFFSVSEFNEIIYTHLQLLGEVVVEGEISEIKVSQNKWLSLTIKDENASLPVFGMIFRLSGWRALEEGMKVRVCGTPRLYQKTARFSLWAEDIVPAGEGALKIAFEKLRAQLDSEGLFDPARKPEMPTFPEKIGLITAKGSQAYNDFTKVLQARMGGITIYFYPIRVQGVNSATSIVNAFTYFNNHSPKLDAVVLTRGGGSLEDLQSFNDEHVARAIFSSKFPVVCGVGHEGDISLADLVADLRASTPSNAAELLVREREYALSDANHMLHTIIKIFDEAILTRENILLHSVSIMKNIFEKHRAYFYATVTHFYHASRHVEQLVTTRKKDVQEHLSTILSLLLATVTEMKRRLASYERLLSSLDYKNVLKRGYSITKTARGAIIRSAQMVTQGDRVITQLAHGTIVSEVKKQ